MKLWTVGLVAVCGLAPAGLLAAGGDKAAAPAAKKPDLVLLAVMSDELKRAMRDLGSAVPAPVPVAAGKPAGPSAPPPKPYFMSYAVSDVQNVSMSAQFGALSNETGSRRRTADVQIRLGNVARG